MAYERDMIPITITSFEMLRDTLQWCAENGYTYVGHCCYEFYEKRYEIFKKAKELGANGVLIDIEGTTCYDLGVEEEEKAYHGEFQVELDLFVEDSQRLMSVKEVRKRAESRVGKEKPTPTALMESFKPPYYKIPKVAPGPEEDRTRLPLLKGDYREVSFMGGKIVPYEEAIENLIRMLEDSERPTIIVGPLVLWKWNKESQLKSDLVLELLRSFPKLNLHLLPDYKPKNKQIDFSREIDPPNPHLSILHGKHDLTLMIGVHCYRTDFVIRLLRKHTDTKIVTLCALHGHPDSDLSLASVDHSKLRDILRRLTKLQPN
jgi:lipoate-protein ligase A